MRITSILILLLIGSYSVIFAQKNYQGKVDYGNYQYAYNLSLIPKQSNKFDLKITILNEDSTTQIAYQSFVNIEGILAKGKQYKIFVVYAEKPDMDWKTDPTSYVELTFDLADNSLKHTNRGIIAKKEAEKLTSVLDIDLAKDSITEAKAIDYAMQFIVVNYNQLFGNYAISIPDQNPVKQIGKGNTVFVSATDAANSSRDTVSVREKNYAYILTETEKNKYSVEVKLVKQGLDIVNEEIVYSSNIEVIDHRKKYTVKIFYAQGKDYTWRTTPQSFVQMEFNLQKKLIRSQVFGKLKESQTGKFVAITKFTNAHQYTQQDMLAEAVRFFIRNFNKALLK